MVTINTFTELEKLRSDQTEVFNSFHGHYTATTKKFIVYTRAGEVIRESELIEMLELFKDKQIAVVTAQNHAPWIEEKYNCKFFKIPTAYAHYCMHMPQYNINFDRVFEKTLLSLNNRAQWNRQALYQFILNFKLTDKFYFSYLLGDRFSVGDPKQLFDIQNAVIGKTWYNENLDFDNAFQQLPYRIDDFVDIDLGPGNIEYYEKSFCSFVNETYIDENYNVFFTEKVLKPLAYGHPMLLFSSAGALKALRDLGFETYSSIFDESYDNIDAPQLRFEFLLRIVYDLCNTPTETLYLMYDKIKPVLKYNYDYFWNEFYKNYTKDIELIREQIDDFFG